MARRTKLTPDIQKTLCDCLRSGCYAVTACARAGITESTYYLWLQKGEEGKQPYSEFLESVKKADADAEALLAGTVMRVALDAENPCWQAAMTMLERRHPERWGRRNRVDLGNADDKPFRSEAKYPHLSIAELAALAARGAADVDDTGGTDPK